MKKKLLDNQLIDDGQLADAAGGCGRRHRECCSPQTAWAGHWTTTQVAPAGYPQQPTTLPARVNAGAAWRVPPTRIA